MIFMNKKTKDYVLLLEITVFGGLDFLNFSREELKGFSGGDGKGGKVLIFKGVMST